MYISLLILTGTCGIIREFTPNREWYLPFQKFRYKLVKLIDELLDILANQTFYFTFDGQTIILEDYLEIRPERKEELLHFIRDGKIAVGPWYLLPDIWLVGQESLIRNLEYSYDLAKELDVPLMQIGYLPDMFGHSRAIPQLIGDLTNFKSVMVWRGVPPEITTVPFLWKSDSSVTSSILAIYLPFGYGNAAMLPEEAEKLTDEIMELVRQLQPYSPLPVYLLHNGTDHQFPKPRIATNLSLVKINNMQISLSVLDDYVLKLQEFIVNNEYSPPEYAGELRSAARAHLLQDTYSSRMWIKQWNQKIEDMLVNYAEPLNTYTWYYLNDNYPTSFLSQAWKWHLRNQPHDSICGCSVDQTHEEMRFRYYWAESIAEMTIENAITTLKDTSQPSITYSCLAFNPTNCSKPIGIVFNVSGDILVNSVRIDNQEYQVQPFQSSTNIVWEMTLGGFKLRTLMKMFPGRRLMNYYINKTSLMEGLNPEICEVQLEVGDRPEGELDMREMKKELLKVIDSKKYKKFHILITKEHEQSYFTWAPLKPWSFAMLEILDSFQEKSSSKTLIISKDRVSNDFYDLTFNKDGSFDIKDKSNDIYYSKLHQFEDWGDRGDEYTFGRLGPEFVKVEEVKRTTKLFGPLFCEIQQNMILEFFQEVDESRENRIGKRKVPISTIFRFYRDSPQIDMKTTITNVTKDHRLRICFDLPFETEHTYSSTHFGCIKRPSDPVGDETYIEKPSGIQPQKRYIRVEDKESQRAFSLMNKGLPEVELENRRRLALTLIRSIGWLSCSGIPERPEHAGPRIPTPRAQELNVTYIFEYSIVVHSKNDPLWLTEAYSESFSLQPITTYFSSKTPSVDILQPLIQVLNPNIRISSLRVRQEKLYVTMFNLLSEAVNTVVKFPSNVVNFTQIKFDGLKREENELVENQITLNFDPHEIKMCTFM
ncbi:MAG: glycoside hydrolase family 38 C-terminal domain-containing protein [Promethearchaeota archaeon]